MWFGFAVRHVAKKATIGVAVVAGAALATRSGRRIARVLVASVKGAGMGAINEIKAQKLADSSRAGLK